MHSVASIAKAVFAVFAPVRTRAVRRGLAPPSADARLIRGLDVVGTLLALLLLAPLLAIIAALINLEDGGPVFYAHRRIGRGGRTFGCLKFRSMTPDAAGRLQMLLDASAEARAEWARDHKLRTDPRRTAVGVFLRKTSLDELPQLLNVLRGEMSLVGPRPIVAEERARYGRRFASYARVRPGITGLWQVSGRNDTTYRRRVALDHRFVQRYGCLLYLWILVVTVPAVLLRRGSY